MKKVITEGDLRAAMLPPGLREFAVDEDTRLTPAAAEFLKSRGIAVVRRPPGDLPVMSRTPLPQRGSATYIDAATGQGYSHKPEAMTHLRGNLLVPKTHPRILLRGRLDSLQAKVLEVQLAAQRQGLPRLVSELEELLAFIRGIVAAEVKDTPLGEVSLLGLDADGLRDLSHNIRRETGVDHPVPHYTMGEAAVALNSLRTQVREAELAAAMAFGQPGQPRRDDIILALNRLSSGVYILFCRVLAGRFAGGAADE